MQDRDERPRTRDAHRGPRWSRAASLAGVMGALTWSAPLAADTIEVPADHATIQAALDAAESGDTIRIAAGVHEIDALLQVEDKTLVIEGAAGADGTPATIIRGAGNHRLFEAGQVYDSELPAADLVLRHLAFENGLSEYVPDGDGPYRAGGVSVIRYRRAEIENCRFEGHRYEKRSFARGAGLVLFMLEEARVADTIFRDNLVRSEQSTGGGMHVVGGADDATATKLHLERCRFEENRAEDEPDNPFNFPRGGYAAAFSGTYRIDLEMADCDLVGNVANYYGGFVMIDFTYGEGGNAIEMRNCRIEGNTAHARVGAFASGDGRTHLIDCIVRENRGGDLQGVGAIEIGVRAGDPAAELILESSEVSGNFATGRDGWSVLTGGIRLGLSASATVIDSRVCGNFPSQVHGDEVHQESGALISSDCDAACAGDVNRDGVLDAADFGALLAAWGDCTLCPSDLDGNGVVDGKDLGLLFQGWGACR